MKKIVRIRRKLDSGYVRLHLWLPKDLVQAIEIKSKMLGISANHYVVNVLKNFVNGWG